VYPLIDVPILDELVLVREDGFNKKVNTHGTTKKKRVEGN